MPVSRKNQHYPISNLFSIVLLYIVEAKKGCKKKSLNILSLAADLLKFKIYKFYINDIKIALCEIYVFLSNLCKFLVVFHVLTQFLFTYQIIYQVFV